MKPLTYLLVDFENVKPSATEVAQVRGAEFRLWIFRGPHQNKFDADMVEAWQPLGENVKFVRSVRAGKNALDFHIAFCLGLAHRENVGARRSARYIVVSKDGGFDALFDYARTEHCDVTNAATIGDALSIAASMAPATLASLPPDAKPGRIPTNSADALKSPEQPVAKRATESAAAAKTPANATAAKRTTLYAEDVEKAITYLREHGKNRPTKRAALENHVAHILGKGVAEKVARAVVDHLIRDKLVNIANSKIEYKLSRKKS